MKTQKRQSKKSGPQPKASRRLSSPGPRSLSALLAFQTSLTRMKIQAALDGMVADRDGFRLERVHKEQVEELLDKILVMFNEALRQEPNAADQGAAE